MGITGEVHLMSALKGDDERGITLCRARHSACPGVQVTLTNDEVSSPVTPPTGHKGRRLLFVQRERQYARYSGTRSARKAERCWHMP